MFLKLTGIGGYPLFVNTEKILWIWQYTAGAYIYFGDQHVVVKETMDEVMAKMSEKIFGYRAPYEPKASSLPMSEIPI